MTRVRLICGTARSQRANLLDALAHEYWGRVRLLVPTRQYAAKRLEHLMRERGIDGVWGRPILTMDGLAADILSGAGLSPVRVQDHERRLLMRQALARHAQHPALRELGAVTETAGFATHVLRVIVQLKQGAIEPELFAERVATRKHRSSLDDAVSLLYSAYQEALLEANLYDLPGLFWRAEAECRQGTPRAMRGVDALLLDGFDDFTPSEFRLLEALAEHVELLVFGINYDSDPDRADLYRATAKTAQQIAERFDTSQVTCEEGEPDSLTAYAAYHLFGRNALAPSAPLRADLELVACPDPTQEIEYIARRVKALLLDGCAPESVAVVFRSLGGVDETVRSVFGEAGIPLRVLQNPSLSTSALVALLLAFFDAVAGWEREAVVDVLMSPWLSWRSPHAAGFRLLARTAQILGGLREWQRSLTRLSGRLEHPDKNVARIGRRMLRCREAIASLSEGVESLAALNDAIPSQGTLAAFAAATERLLDGLGVAQVLADPPSDVEPGISTHEAAAWTALRDLLASLRTRDARRPLTMTRDEFVAYLRKVLSELSFRPPQPARGVACLDAVGARHLRFDHVFLAGLVEGEVPSPPSLSAIYGDEDIAQLAATGIVLEDKRAHGERESLLFHHMLATVRERLIISWSTLSRDGKERYPSPYVRDLIRALGSQAPQIARPSADAFAPAVDEAAAPRELRNSVFRGDAGPACGLFVRADRGARLEAGRQNAPTPSPYMGALLAEDLVSGVAKDYGEQHMFSVSQIETYLACPFRFLTERLLGIDLEETPEAEFDAMVRGGILHAVLRAFHSHYVGRAIVDIPEDEARTTMRAILDDVFESRAWQSATTPEGVSHVERLRLASQLERYLEIARGKLDTWYPSHFETRFGHAPDDGGQPEDSLSRSEPYSLDTGSGVVLFSGRIDRIDTDTKSLRLIDYKTSKAPSAKEITSGRSIQLGLYTLATEDLLLPGEQVSKAEFLPIGSTQSREVLGRGAPDTPKDKWPERRKLLLESITRAVRGIREGAFAPTPLKEICQVCALATLAPGRACRCTPFDDDADAGDQSSAADEGTP